MKKTKTYDRAIEELKKLRAKMRLDNKYKQNYKDKIQELCTGYGLSDKTIYRDMHKKIPSIRKRRTDLNKIKVKPGKRESEMILEALEKGKNLGESGEIVNEQMGKKITRTMTKRVKDVINISEEKKESSYGNKFKEFIEKYFGVDLMAHDKNIEVRINKYKFTVCVEDLKDIVLILTNAYNRWQVKNEEDLPLDRELLREVMIMHLFEEQIRNARELNDVKSVDMLTRIYDRMKITTKLNTDFAVFEKCMRELKPGIKKEEVIQLIKNNSKE